MAKPVNRVLLLFGRRFFDCAKKSICTKENPRIYNSPPNVKSRGGVFEEREKAGVVE